MLTSPAGTDPSSFHAGSAISTCRTTTGSIMPQKRNPDVLELLRAKAAKVLVAANRGRNRAPPSGYNRDLQEVGPLHGRLRPDDFIAPNHGLLSPV